MQEIFELTSDDQWLEAITVLKELRPELTIDYALANRESLIASGYRLYGLFQNGQIVCVAGVAIQPHIARGREFWVHDLVTNSSYRSQGLGQKMMRFLETEARRLGCSRLLVHTRLERKRSQKFYETDLGYRPYALVFTQDLETRRETVLQYS